MRYGYISVKRNISLLYNPTATPPKPPAIKGNLRRCLRPNPQRYRASSGSRSEWGDEKAEPIVALLFLCHQYYNQPDEENVSRLT